MSYWPDPIEECSDRALTPKWPEKNELDHPYLAWVKNTVVCGSFFLLGVFMVLMTIGRAAEDAIRSERAIGVEVGVCRETCAAQEMTYLGHEKGRCACRSPLGEVVLKASHVLLPVPSSP